MTGSTAVDIVIVLIALFALRSGWRQGGIASVMAVVGVIVGGATGLWVAPYAMERTDSNGLRFLLALGIAVLSVVLGFAVGSVVGARFRNTIRTRSAYEADAVLGAVVQFFTALIVVWLVALPLAASQSGDFARSLRGSRVLGAIDRVVPSPVTSWGNRIGAFLNSNGMPSLTEPFTELPNKDVEAPADSVLSTEKLNDIRPSVVQVVSTAQQCRKMLEGTGFVIAQDTVVTNAHVVAGANEVRLRTVNGEDIATVVYFNPDEDVAVLHAVGLGLPSLPIDPELAESGADAVVVGFPLGGPFDVQNARIRDDLRIEGPNIYSSARVQRHAYTVRGLIREGNSGGPLVDGDGEVIGMVFGAAVDVADTGYALTQDEMMKAIGSAESAENLRTAVSTQSCVAR